MRYASTMMRLASLLALPALALAMPLAAHDVLPAGIWTNTEDEYFAGEENRPKPEWVGFEVAQDGKWRSIDGFAKPIGDWREDSIPGLAMGEGGGWTVNGSELRQARDFICWMSVRKFAAKPDGSEDWTFNRVNIHDQGGRVFLDGKGEAPDVTIRMRNVTWAKGSTNNPVTVLYIHKDDPVRAESYSWAAPESAIVGVNLRWMQGGCNLPERSPGPGAKPR